MLIRKIKQVVLLAAMGFIFLLPHSASALSVNPFNTSQTQSELRADLDKKPLLEVTIPGLNFSNISSSTNENGTYFYIAWIPELISALYKFGLAIVSIVAAVVIVVQGVRVIGSGGGEGKTEAYKKSLQSVIGLFIAWGSYAILYNINPALVQFNALKVKVVDAVPLDPLYVGSDEITITADELTPATQASGDTPYAKLTSICKPAGTGSASTLQQILPTWVDIGSHGGAQYVRGGWKDGSGCTSFGANNWWLLNFFEKHNISPPVPNTPTNVGNMSAADQKALNKDTTLNAALLKYYNEKVVPNYTSAGVLCGDCGTWIQQLYLCSGMAKNIKTNRFYEEGSNRCDAPYCLAGDPQKTCGEVASTIPGGLKFGDIFRSLAFGHWFLYTGGAGLPYEMAQMGGQGPEDRCGKIPGIDGKVTCVNPATKISNFYMWGKGKGCYIFRVYQ